MMPANKLSISSRVIVRVRMHTRTRIGAFDVMRGQTWPTDAMITSSNVRVSICNASRLPNKITTRSLMRCVR